MRRVLAAALLVTATLQAQAIRNNEGFRASSVARNDDGSSSLVPIGFNVNFFGRTGRMPTSITMATSRSMQR